MGVRTITLLVLVPAIGCTSSGSRVHADAASDQCQYEEPNDTIMTAMPFAMADTGEAALCSNGASEDFDFYKFTIPNASTVTVKIDFVAAHGDLDLRLYDATTMTMKSESRGFGDQELVTCPGTSPSCPQLAAGDYVFEVLGATTGVTNNYTPSLTIATP